MAFCVKCETPYTTTSGTLYVGDFADGVMDGQGRYTYANGRVEEGRWEEGKFVG